MAELHQGAFSTYVGQQQMLKISLLRPLPGPHGLLSLHQAGTCQASPRRRCVPVAAIRAGKRSGSQQLVPSQPAQTLSPFSAPIWVKLPLAVLAVAALFQVYKRFKGSNSGSMTTLESRGLIDEDRHGKDIFYTDIMKNVNTVQMEELSKDQIAAARARRLKERESWTVDIDDIVLPDNHPFAVKKPVSKEDEELVEARLNVRRGLPLQDLSGRRGLPDDGKGAVPLEFPEPSRGMAVPAEAPSRVQRPGPRISTAKPNAPSPSKEWGMDVAESGRERGRQPAGR